MLSEQGTLSPNLQHETRASPSGARTWPGVTAVIPTRGRPDLLIRAIGSVLDQEGVRPDVLVVIDGPRDAATEAVLEAIDDDRVLSLVFEDNRGPAVCRTAGARAVRTEFVAFLDDDDAWLPGKLAAQFAALSATGGDRAIVSCRSRVETPTGTYIWPRRLPREGERAGDWLFCRHSLFKGESFVQASSILCRRDLFEEFPQRRVAHEDWDWLLRACEQGGCRLVVHPEPLVRHLAEFRRESLSNRHDFRSSFRWALSIRRIVSREAFAGLLLQTLNGALTESRDWRGALRLLRLARRHGDPRAFDLLLFLLQWMLPMRARRRLRSMVFDAPDRTTGARA